MNHITSKIPRCVNHNDLLEYIFNRTIIMERSLIEKKQASSQEVTGKSVLVLETLVKSIKAKTVGFSPGTHGLTSCA